MLEKEIEAYLVRRVKEMGGIAYKFVSPQRRSVPDRVIVIKDVPIFFVELKSSVGKLTEGQEREIARLRELGKLIFVCNSREQVDKILNDITWVYKK